MLALRTWLRFALAVVLLAVGVSAYAGGLPTKTVKVRCAKGDSIARALALGDVGKPLLVLIEGTCTESVTIDRSDVTLSAAPSGGGIVGPDAAVDVIAVTGNRVTIEGLTISGGRFGVLGKSATGLVVRGATISAVGRGGVYFAAGTSGRVEGCALKDNARDGLALGNSSSATVLNSLITGNARHGVYVVNGSSALIGLDEMNLPSPTTITANGSNGISVNIGSSILLANTEISGNGTDPLTTQGRAGVFTSSASAVALLGGNSISGNAAQGISANGSRISIGGPLPDFPDADTISGNGVVGNAGGIFGYNGSTVVVSRAFVTGNFGAGLNLGLKSSAQVSSSTISNNSVGSGILVSQGSALITFGPTTSYVNNNAAYGVYCVDGESSVMLNAINLSGNPLGPTSAGCTGF